MLVSFSSRVRKHITFALVALMIASGLMTPSGIAAQGQSVQSQLTGVTIAYGPPYELQSDLGVVDESVEMIMFLGAADILAMGFLPEAIDLNGARDILLDALFGEQDSSATIDRGDYSGVSYSLDMLNIDGQEMGVFSLFMNQRSHGFSEFYIFIAPPSLFASTMQTAQDTITVDGNPLMDGVDATAMGNMVTANVGITGGEEVTDVTDVTDTTETTPEATETATTETGESDRVSYLLQVSQEYATADQAFADLIGLLEQLGDGADPQEIRPQLDAANEILAGTNDRIAAIQPPAGMEEFHQEFLAWGQALTDAGTTWFLFVDGQATSEEASAATTDALNTHVEFGEKLQAENQAAANETETPTEETPEVTETTEATTEATTTSQTSTSGSDEGTEYLNAVQAHRTSFLESLTTFNDHLSVVGEGASDEEIRSAAEGTIVEAEYWASFSAEAEQLTPPAGYEDVHETYLNWAVQVTELGNLWIGALNQDGTTVDDFYAQMDVVQAADEELNVAIEGASSQSTGTTSETTDTTPTDETTSGSGRTTRSTGSSSTDETPEATETTSRTTRTTGSSSQDDTNRNTSETQGRNSSTSTNTASTNGNEWHMELNDVTISWDEQFGLSDRAEEPQISDSENGEDKIYLQWTSPEGTAVRFTVSAFPNSGTDSTTLVSALIDDEAALVELFGEEAQIVDSVVTDNASALLVNSVDEYGEFWIYFQFTCVTPDCSTVSMLLIATESDTMVPTLAALEDGVAIDGNSVSNAIPAADVENAIVRFGG